MQREKERESRATRESGCQHSSAGVYGSISPDKNQNAHRSRLETWRDSTRTKDYYRARYLQQKKQKKTRVSHKSAGLLKSPTAVEQADVLLKNETAEFRRVQIFLASSTSRGHPLTSGLFFPPAARRSRRKRLIGGGNPQGKRRGDKPRVVYGSEEGQRQLRLECTIGPPRDGARNTARYDRGVRGRVQILVSRSLSQQRIFTSIRVFFVWRCG